ncbi:serine protease [Oscillatoria acuminata]|uniref:TPR repeat-containing protein n=1 Tax=Oscillatoria acuminata PCC 6304 TaxID=56110 RepID=K9TH78_9CYAN|nr:serine protease [Oscillatoria acuminata]AFY81753.1 TPR repeat-containing protein [Oscillatoria acuminata PCC 6304]
MVINKPSEMLLVGALLLLTPTLHSCQILPSISQPQINPNLSPEELHQLASAITVKVIGGESAGSGTIIRKVGRTYTVVTNQHVLQAVQGTSKYRLETNKEDELISVANIRIQTSDGLDYPATIVRGENINFQDNDLGLLEFNADKTYDVGTFPKSDLALKPGEKVWAAGFPAESPTPTSIVTEGTVSLIPDQALEQGYQLGYSNPIQNGMSGGPILNRQGDIIGFNGRQGNPLFGDPFVYANGDRPTDRERQKMVGLSWGLPVSVLAEAAPAMMKEAEPSLTGVAKQVYDNAKAVTVRIEARDKKYPSLDPIPGSGVIIAKQKNTYYVATARHVVESSGQNYELIAPDGRRYRIDYSKIKQQDGQDVALVQFISNEIYSIATLADYRVKEEERPWVFTAGWPKGESLRNRYFEFTPGFLFSSEQSSLAAQNTASLTQGYEMVYTNSTQGGMSGGPVLDIQGRVVGIHGRAESGEFGGVQLGRSLGIPANTLLGSLQVWGIEREWLQVETDPPPELDIHKDIHKFVDMIAALAVTQKTAPKQDATARDWINYGNQLWRVGRSEQAIEAFNQAIHLNRNSYAAWYARGLALSAADRDREAVWSFEQAIVIDNTPHEAWREQGKSLLFLKQYPQALASIDQAIQRQNQDAVLYMFRAGILSALNRYQEAVAAYTIAIDITPHSWAYNNRGAIRKDLGDVQGAIDDFNQAIKINPQNTNAYYNRGNARKESGDWQGVIADYTKAIDLNPQYADAYNNRGVARKDSGDLSGAIADYTKAIELNPLYAGAYYNRGYARKDSGDLSGAIDDYNQAIKINPQDAEAYVRRGIARAHSGDLPGAISDFTETIKINPQYALAYNNRGNARKDSGDLAGAIDDYNQAIKINPQLALAYNNRGNARRNSGDLSGAISDFTEAIKINPQYADAYYNRGVASSILEDMPGAISDFTEAIKINPQYADAYLNRGIVSSMSEDMPGAISDFTEAIKINPQYADAYYNRGVARYLSEDKQGGIEDIQKGEQLLCQQGKPECQQAKDALKQIEVGRSGVGQKNNLIE